ncbi:hypothetical protein AC579_5471 [Pseudocercospora musae]|uniref:Uncharacterized protein n=1 Tax=Pseudocercospora musae TaxID=113226 RepID=A0A139IPW0_9PEZI|nr:hypothetical protein AC579_5471 [Pseudocercospora musae]
MQIYRTHDDQMRPPTMTSCTSEAVAAEVVRNFLLLSSPRNPVLDVKLARAFRLDQLYMRWYCNAQECTILTTAFNSTQTSTMNDDIRSQAPETRIMALR